MPDPSPKKKPADSMSVLSKLMMLHQANNLGQVFGGEVLSMVDRAAAVAAMRHSGCSAVTVSIDRVDFRESIHTGWFSAGFAPMTRMTSAFLMSFQWLVMAPRPKLAARLATVVDRYLDGAGVPRRPRGIRRERGYAHPLYWAPFIATGDRR